MTRLLPMAVFALLTPCLAAAQDRRDFSGVWKMDPARSQSAQPGQGVPPVSEVIVDIARRGGDLWVDSVRDGVRTTARFPVSQMEPAKPVGTSGQTGVGHITSWDATALVTSTPIEINGWALRSIEKRTLSADGREMRVETSLGVEHGYTSSGKTYSATVTDVYVRAPALP